MADYTYFMFDDISSSKYNLYIQNNGEDLSYPSQPGFENQIVSPLYQGTSFLAGVNKTSRQFSFNCWADSINKDSVRSMLEWLSPDKIGELVLDYNQNYYYNTKLASITDFKHMAINEDGTSNYEFQLSFITIGDFAAISRTDFVINQKVNPLNATEAVFLNPDNLAPIGVWSDSKIKIFNYASEPLYLDFILNNTITFEIKKNSVTQYKYKFVPYSGVTDLDFVVNSQYGFAKVGSSLAEATQGVSTLTADLTNLGTMTVDSGTPEVLYTTINNYNTTLNPDVITLNYTEDILTFADGESNLYLVLQDGDYGIELDTQILTNSENQEYLRNLIDSYGYTKTEADTLLLDKVDKVAGKSLVSDTTITDLTDSGDTTLHKHDRYSILATNLVSNGDFSNGITGWSGVNASITAITNILSITGNGTTQLPYAQQIIPFGINTNKFYVKAKARVTNSLAKSIRLRYYGSSGVDIKLVSSPIINTWYELSGMFTNNQISGGGTDPIIIRHDYEDAATANGKVMEVQYVSVINLTAIFGAGNEPTALEMDTLLAKYPNSWFNGTNVIADLSEVKKLSVNHIQNEVSVDNAKVEALATGVVVTRNVADANTPLIVNNQQGTSKIAEFRFGNANKASIDKYGNIIGYGVDASDYFTSSNGLRNNASVNNAYFNSASAGAKISRNIADANPALIVNQANASSTGKILIAQFGGVEKAYITPVGYLATVGLFNIANSNNSTVYTSTAGTKIERNVADANTALVVNQNHTSSTGLISEFQAGGVGKVRIDTSGGILASNVKNIFSALNSIVFLNDTGTIIRRNIADANPALIVNQANASSTGNIQSWQLAGVDKMTLNYLGRLTNNNGFFTTDGLYNSANGANASVGMPSTGVAVSRNIADSNSALKINQQHASSTGNILDLQFGGVNQGCVSKNGTFQTNQAIGRYSDINQGYLSFQTTGMIMQRNVADANPALIVNQAHASSTGDILQLKAVDVIKARVNRSGDAYLTSLNNITTGNNSKLELTANGSVFSRNIADANTALIVNQNNAGSTGNIFEARYTNVSKFSVDKDGNAFVVGGVYASYLANRNLANNSILYMNDGGAVLYRNIADGGTVLNINQLNPSATGLLLDLAFNSESKFSVNKDGVIEGRLFKTTHNIPMISKYLGYKSWLFHRDTTNSFVFASSATINAEDWNWDTAIMFNDAGDVRAKTLTAYAPSGTAPMIIVSSALVANLNSDLLDSQHGSHYLARANHTGTQSADTIVDGSTNHVFTAADDTKLAGIESGAEVNNISDVNATDLTDSGDTTLHKHDRYADKLMATNLVTNGDFLSTTVWKTIGNGFAWSVSNNEAVITNLGTSGSSYKLYQTPGTIIGNKYYIRTEMMSNSSSDGIALSGAGIKYHSGSGQYEALSIIVTSISTNDDLRFLFTTRTGDISANPLKIKKSFSVNLTALFGTGKEPTIAQFEAWLALLYPTMFFNGTVEFTTLKNLFNEKADKTQEAWIVATLLNGATGVVKYAKNSLGLVTIWIDAVIANSTYNTIQCALPSGYLPPVEFPMILRNYSVGGVSAQFIIDTSGNLRVLGGVSNGHGVRGIMTFYVGG